MTPAPRAIGRDEMIATLKELEEHFDHYIRGCCVTEASVIGRRARRWSVALSAIAAALAAQPERETEAPRDKSSDKAIQDLYARCGDAETRARNATKRLNGAVALLRAIQRWSNEQPFQEIRMWLTAYDHIIPSDRSESL